MNLIKKRLAKLRKLKMEIAMEMAESLIRKAEKKDFPAIKNLLSTYFLDLEGLKAEEFILAEKAGRIIGCTAMITTKKNERRGERRYEQVFLEIHSIAIHPSFRGKGIGRKLIENLITTIKTSTIETSSDQKPARKFPPPELQTLELYVRTTAPGFFEKLGFEKLPPSKKQELWNDCTQCELFEKCTQTVLKYPG